MTAVLALAAVLVGPAGIVLGWFLSRKDDERRWERERVASADTWRRDNLFAAAVRYSDATQKFIHEANLMSVELNEGRSSAERTDAVLEAIGEMDSATSGLMLLGNQDLIDEAIKVSTAAIESAGALRNGKPIGLGTPWESQWRTIGRGAGGVMLLTRLALGIGPTQPPESHPSE